MIGEEEKKVYDVLEKLGISYVRYGHDPVYTMEDLENLKIDFQGQQCKNLFVRNRKGDQHYLVMVAQSKSVNLKSLSTEIGSTPLSFASEERLYKYLGLQPGAVSPFGLLKDREKHVEVLLDKDLSSAGYVGVHPNVNTASIVLSYEDLEKFLQSCGQKIAHVTI